MAEEKRKKREEGPGSSAAPGAGGMQRVLVEMRIPKGSGAAYAMQMGAGLNVPSFQVDSSFEPVPIPPSSDQAATLEAAGEEVVCVCGTIEEGKIAELESQPNVVKVYRDFPIAPFPAEAIQEEELTQLVSSEAFGTCPIPPCDCDPRTAKGAIADVARYLGVDQIWARGHRGEGIVIGIVDGGISAQGRVSGGTIPRVIGGWPTADWGTRAFWGGHGNMTATDSLGMAPRGQVYDIRIAAGGIQATISAALSGFQWAITRHRANGTPHILSNSWGIFQKNWDPDYATNRTHVFTRKVEEALNEGILVLFAAGNCGQACPSSRCGSDTGPGQSIWGANGHPWVMTVGAANTKGQLIGYSSQGPAALDPHKPDFCSISHFRGYFASDTGTSAACPVAAGVVALLKQARPSLTQGSAKAALKQTAKNIGPAGWDKHSGSGIIQAKAAYDRVVPRLLTCGRYRAAAVRYRNLYRRTRNRRYLCLYYRYLAAYYRCLYLRTRNRRYLCLYYRYLAAYYRCLYLKTRNRRYLLLYRRYFNLYRRCR